MPVIVVDDDDQTAAMHFARFAATMMLRGESLSKVKGVAYTLSLLHDYAWERSADGEASTSADLVAGFLASRRNGLKAGAVGSLVWEPMRFETVERDRQYLKLYSDFCHEHFGYLPFIESSPQGDPVDRRQAMRLLAKRRNMLLGHVAHHARDGTQTLVKLRERPAGKRGSGRTFLPTSAVESLIEGTHSIVQKMAFILAAFGGPRASEILNLWRCDVLPGRYRPTLFLDDVESSAPLVVLAHPSQSTYVGDMRVGTRDRLQFLSEMGLTPRNLMEGDPLVAGWKGMEFDNRALLISQVFWSDMAWATTFQSLYRRLQDEIMPVIPDHVRRSHPYLIVNDDPSRAEFGQPMKMSNLRKAFDRALERTGIDRSRYHQGLHGLRHFYKDRIRALGLDNEERRKAMHHVSPESESDYGRSSAHLNNRLALVHDLDGDPC